MKGREIELRWMLRRIWRREFDLTLSWGGDPVETGENAEVSIGCPRQEALGRIPFWFRCGENMFSAMPAGTVKSTSGMRKIEFECVRNA
jgi:hypothetical protein